MIEIFKTDVNVPSKASQLVELICLYFHGCSASFDLEDCDKVLRVYSEKRSIPSHHIIKFMREMGFRAEILSDETPSIVDMLLHDTKYHPVPE
jgi:hypothetical protein